MTYAISYEPVSMLTRVTTTERYNHKENLNAY
jgi:hypothetical protein